MLAEFGEGGLLPVALTVANGAALARLDLGANKYALWCAVAAMLPWLCEPRRAASRAWLLLCAASVAMLVASAWQRGLRGPTPEKVVRGVLSEYTPQVF